MVLLHRISKHFLCASLCLPRPTKLLQEIPPEHALGHELLHLERESHDGHDDESRPGHPLELRARLNSDIDDADGKAHDIRDKRNDGQYDTPQQEEKRRAGGDGAAQPENLRRQALVRAEAQRGGGQQDEQQHAGEEGGEGVHGDDGDEEQVDGPGGQVGASLVDEAVDRVDAAVDGLADGELGTVGHVEDAQGAREHRAGLEAEDGPVVGGRVEGGLAAGEEAGACEGAGRCDGSGVGVGVACRRVRGGVSAAVRRQVQRHFPRDVEVVEGAGGLLEPLVQGILDGAEDLFHEAHDGVLDVVELVADLVDDLVGLGLGGRGDGPGR